MALTVTPSALTISVTGASNVAKTADINVTQNQYTGEFSASSSDNTKARVTCKTGTTPVGSAPVASNMATASNFSVFSVAAGAATLTFIDDAGNSATCAVTVNA